MKTKKIIAVGALCVFLGCAFFARFVFADAGGSSSPAPELLAHWTFDEESGDLILDHSGNAHDALLLASNHVWHTDEGPGGGALYFDGGAELDGFGSGGHVVAAGLAGQFSDPAFTVCAWIRPETLAEWNPVIAKVSDPSAWDDGFTLRAGGEENIVGGAALSTNVWSGPIPIGAWTHVALSCDGASEMTLYINGLPEMRAALSAQELAQLSSNALLNIGSISDGGRVWPWHGEIADARVYTGALAASEIFDVFIEASESEAVDSDADGMPDLWELQYGLNPRDPADAAQDPDNDNFTNLQEYRLGMNPTKAAVVSTTPLLKVYTPME